VVAIDALGAGKLEKTRDDATAGSGAIVRVSAMDKA
jgi:hypothetical protein